MSISAFFDSIGAPLTNVRWSWGGIKGDGAVVLRVWQNETIRRDEGLWIQLTHHSEFADRQHDLGYQERNRHVEHIKAGAPCFMVMCEAQDLNEVPRVIKGFNNRELFRGGELQVIDGDVWVKVISRDRV